MDRHKLRIDAVSFQEALAKVTQRYSAEQWEAILRTSGFSLACDWNGATIEYPDKEV